MHRQQMLRLANTRNFLASLMPVSCHLTARLSNPKFCKKDIKYRLRDTAGRVEAFANTAPAAIAAHVTACLSGLQR